MIFALLIGAAAGAVVAMVPIYTIAAAVRALADRLTGRHALRKERSRRR